MRFHLIDLRLALIEAGQGRGSPPALRAAATGGAIVLNRLTVNRSSLSIGWIY
jgi:hypothetical protein